MFDTTSKLGRTRKAVFRPGPWVFIALVIEVFFHLLPLVRQYL